jgi:hypothetical protein
MAFSDVSARVEFGDTVPLAFMDEPITAGFSDTVDVWFTDNEDIMAIHKDLDLFANMVNKLRLSKESAPLSIVGWEMVFELRRQASDAVALVTEDAILVDEDLGTARVDLTAAQMALAPGRYPYKVIRTDEGDVCVAWGTAIVRE